MKSIQVKVNKSVGPYMKDQVVTVQTDELGTPVRRFWRDRLRDAKVDNCVEIVKEKKAKPATQTKKESPKEES